MRYGFYLRWGTAFGCLRRHATVLAAGARVGVPLLNIRYKQRRLVQQLHESLLLLGGGAPKLLNRGRTIALLAALGRGELLAAGTRTPRFLLRCSKLAFGRRAPSYLAGGGYLFSRGALRRELSTAVPAGDCLQLAVSASYLAYLAL